MKLDTTSKTENHLHSTDARWFAIYTRFKREKTVLRELTQNGIDAYLPLQKVLRQYGRKKKWVELPLFSCYVFVKITKAEYVPVLSTEGVVRFISFSQNLISIPESEILTIQRIVETEIPLTVQPREFEHGDVVEIISGNLTGMRGILKEVHGKNKVLIELAHLGYTLKLELPSTILRKIVSVNELV